MKTRFRTPHKRTTLPLTGTVARKDCHLDDSSALAVEFAQVWLARAGSLTVPVSGVIRRALALYIRHLSHAEERAEVRAVASACKSFTRPSEEHQLALLRLHAVPDDEPLPAFEVVRDGARVVAERAASHQRIKQLLERLP